MSEARLGKKQKLVSGACFGRGMSGTSANWIPAPANRPRDIVPRPTVHRFAGRSLRYPALAPMIRGVPSLGIWLQSFRRRQLMGDYLPQIELEDGFTLTLERD